MEIRAHPGAAHAEYCCNKCWARCISIPRQLAHRQARGASVFITVYYTASYHEVRLHHVSSRATQVFHISCICEHYEPAQCRLATLHESHYEQHACAVFHVLEQAQKVAHVFIMS